MKPYYNNQKLEEALIVYCGRCEAEFQVVLRKNKDFPRVLCPKCKMENRLNIIWK